MQNHSAVFKYRQPLPDPETIFISAQYIGNTVPVNFGKEYGAVDLKTIRDMVLARRKFMRKFGRFHAMASIGMTMLFAGVFGGGALAGTFSPYVDEKGNISIPKDFRSWSFLGSWGVATDEDGKVGSQGFHNVYTQPETVAAFRKTGKFPDGAVLVKELLKAKTDSMTTGEISYATQTKGWFIMVKDTKDRFKDNKLWGRGWGWALFEAEDRRKTSTEEYESECLPCHMPAQKDDWIYVRGYPVLTE